MLLLNLYPCCCISLLVFHSASAIIVDVITALHTAYITVPPLITLDYPFRWCCIVLTDDVDTWLPDVLRYCCWCIVVMPAESLIDGRSEEWRWNCRGTAITNITCHLYTDVDYGVCRLVDDWFFWYLWNIVLTYLIYWWLLWVIGLVFCWYPLSDLLDWGIVWPIAIVSQPVVLLLLVRRYLDADQFVQYITFTFTPLPTYTYTILVLYYEVTLACWHCW